MAERTPHLEKALEWRGKVREEIRKWLTQAEGWFYALDLDRDLGLNTSKLKQIRRQFLYELHVQTKIQKHPEKDSLYKVVSLDSRILDWESANEDGYLDIRFPLELEQYVRIYPRNIIVVAGTFNTGKTAFVLDFIRLNMNRGKEVLLFNSEMGKEELKRRIKGFELPLSQWKFRAYSQVKDFAANIEPDAINCVDYLEFADNFYSITYELAEMTARLNTGVALVALQKKRGAQLGRGAEFSAEKPRLYVSLDWNELTIVKAKNWATKQNPNGKKIKFKLINGARFELDDPYQKKTRGLDEPPF